MVILHLADLFHGIVSCWLQKFGSSKDPSFGTRFICSIIHSTKSHSGFLVNKEWEMETVLV